MISALDSRVMDRNAAALGVPVETLMRNAGRAIADLVSERFPKARVRIFCGHGNNGGDGLVQAEFLPEAKISMVDGTEMGTPASRKAAEAVKERMETFTGKEDDFDVLVDAGLGTGIGGTLRPRWKEYAEFCNGFEGTIISVDVPTGFGTDLQVVPDITITMVDTKEGMTPESCGEIVVADIGMPADALGCTGPGDFLRYPKRSSAAHKGDSGRLLIIGGGPYYGAPVMAAVAAMRAGTDMVYAAVPSRVGPVMAADALETVIEELPGETLRTSDVDRILALQSRCDAVLIGPGLGTDPDCAEAVVELAGSIEKPMVIDADGLNAIGGRDLKLRPDVVLTPHMGELKRLGAKDAGDVCKVASALGCWILLKGPEDIITDGTVTYRNRTGTSAMTSAGTGDVLAGTVAGLMALGMPAPDAARLGAYVVGKAGEYAEVSFGGGLRATDLPDLVASIIHAGTESR